jgi:hypothetical protein
MNETTKKERSPFIPPSLVLSELTAQAGSGYGPSRRTGLFRMIFNQGTNRNIPRTALERILTKIYAALKKMATPADLWPGQRHLTFQRLKFTKILKNF